MHLYRRQNADTMNQILFELETTGLAGAPIFRWRMPCISLAFRERSDSQASLTDRNHFP